MKKLILATLFVCSLFSLFERDASSETYSGGIKFLGNIFCGKISRDPSSGTEPTYDVLGVITFAGKSIVPNLFSIIAEDGVDCSFDFSEGEITGHYKEGRITAALTFQIEIEESNKYNNDKKILNTLNVSCLGIVKTSIIAFGTTDIYIDKKE